MKTPSSSALFAAPLVVALAGCTSPDYNQPEPVVPTATTASAVEYGIVRTISIVDLAPMPRSSSAGAAGGGAMMGGQAYRVDVLTDRGHVRTYQYQDISGVHVGDRVRIEGGKLYRN
jgi:hypothetical protein